MALLINQYLQSTNGLAAALINMPDSPFNTTGSRLYIYGNSVPYPSTCPSSVTAGSFLNFVVNAGAFTQSTGTISLAANVSNTTNAAGTATWWLLINTANGGFACCGNSISNVANVGNASVILSSIAPTSGTSVTCSSVLISIV